MITLLLTALLSANARGPGPQTDPAAGQDVAGGRTVVLMDPGTAEPDTLEQLTQAVSAQLGELDANLVVQHVDDADGPDSHVGARIEHAIDVVAQHEAVGVFWVEQSGGELLLYLVDREGTALLRRVGSSAGEDGANVEAIAVIVRSSTQALLDGRAIGMEPVERDPPPPATPVPAPTPAPAAVPVVRERMPVAPKFPHAGLRLAYAGTSFARERALGAAWQSGLGLQLTWHPLRRAGYAGLGYTFYQAFSDTVTPTDPTLDFDAIVEVRRHPMQVFGGYQLSRRALLVDLELAVVVDVTTAEATPLQSMRKLENKVDVPVMVGLEPRVRLHYLLLDQLSFVLALGAEIVTNNTRYAFSWLDEDGALAEDRTYLTPHPVRPTVSAGLVFWLPGHGSLGVRSRD